MLTSTKHNPDVLTCLANLSSDEVFTPPKLANEMLDALPSELWSNPEAKFLDPCCKSGIFLREIAKRLLIGLEDKIPDHQKRINHIFKNQLYGIAITELTALISRRSLYCSKIANSKYSICNDFDDAAGNIRYVRTEHTWMNGKCIYCGASKDNYKRDKSLESHSYEFIHTNKQEEIFNMKFDVIIGNPPYQFSDGGGSGKSAIPIYQKFVSACKKMSPKNLIMIIPARWYAGGKGLDSFRSEMLSDTQIRKIVDYKSAIKVFPGVEIAGGVCYFHWEKNTSGKTDFVGEVDGEMKSVKRYLNEFPILVRDSLAISIIKGIRKIENSKFKSIASSITPRKPFGLSSTYKPKDRGVSCLFTKSIGMSYANSSDVIDTHKILNKWKVLIPIAPIAGQTDFSKPLKIYHENNVQILKPKQCCTETWIIVGAFNSKKEAEILKSYILTKIFRFLLLQAVVSQNITRGNFIFVPLITINDSHIDDAYLRKRWEISEAEWKYIDSKIN